MEYGANSRVKPPLGIFYIMYIPTEKCLISGALSLRACTFERVDAASKTTASVPAVATTGRARSNTDSSALRTLVARTLSAWMPTNQGPGSAIFAISQSCMTRSSGMGDPLLFLHMLMFGRATPKASAN